MFDYDNNATITQNTNYNLNNFYDPYLYVSGNDFNPFRWFKHLPNDIYTVLEGYLDENDKKNLVLALIPETLSDNYTDDLYEDDVELYEDDSHDVSVLDYQDKLIKIENNERKIFLVNYMIREFLNSYWIYYKIYKPFDGIITPQNILYKRDSDRTIYKYSIYDRLKNIHDNYIDEFIKLQKTNNLCLLYEFYFKIVNKEYDLFMDYIYDFKYINKYYDFNNMPGYSDYCHSKKLDYLNDNYDYYYGSDYDNDYGY